MTSTLKIEESYHDNKEMDGADKIEQVQEYDEDTRRIERRLVRKLDMTLMPVVWILYFFNYMDRTNIA